MKIKTKMNKIFVMTLVLAMVTMTFVSVVQSRQENNDGLKDPSLETVSTITIIEEIPPTTDSENLNHKMQLEIPQSVIEGESFVVYVYGPEVEGVAVGFKSGSYFSIEGYTGPDGSVTLTAPMVEKDTFVMIGARKEGYAPCVARITVLDTPPNNHIYQFESINKERMLPR